jgi:CBS domain-containing protein
MQIKEYMKHLVYTVDQDASLRNAAQLLVQHKIGTLPVIDHDRRLVGLLHMRKILALVMPDFVNLLENFSFLHDFGAVENRRIPEGILSLPVKDVMDPPVFVDETSGLLRTAAMINKLNLMEIPVVDKDHRLIGIVSRVDIGTALLRLWDVISEE